MLTGPDSNNIGAYTRSEHNAPVYTEKLAGTKYSKHMFNEDTTHLTKKNSQKGIRSQKKFEMDNIQFKHTPLAQRPSEFMYIVQPKKRK